MTKQIPKWLWIVGAIVLFIFMQGKKTAMNSQTGTLLLFTFGIPLAGAGIGYAWKGMAGAIIGLVVGIVAELLIGIAMGGFGGMNYIIS